VKLFHALAKEAELRVSEFNTQEISDTAWAFARVNQLDEKLFLRWRERRGCE